MSAVAPVTRRYAAEAVATTLAAEARCRPADLRAERVRLSELASGWRDDPLRRRFRLPEDSLAITTMGSGVIVSATTRWMGWVAELFRDAGPDEAFGPRLLGEASRRVSRHSYRLHGPLLYNVTTSQDWRAHEAPAGYTVEVGGPELVESLDPADWPNAISPRVPTLGRRIALAAAATRRGLVVGVATAGTDSDTLWQIGIDVSPEHRARGLGAVLTSRSARAVLDHGRVPYYAATIGNIGSRRTALSAGFYPCWVSAFTMEQ